MKTFITVAAVAALAASCTPPEDGVRSVEPSPMLVETSSGAHVRIGAEAGGSTGSVAGDVARIWSLLPEVYQVFGIEPAQVSEESLQMGNPRVSLARVGGVPVERYLRCGNEGAGPSAMSRYRVRFGILTTLRAESATSTSVNTEVQGTAVPIDGTSSGRVLCASTGLLELEIRKLLAERLGG